MLLRLLFALLSTMTVSFLLITRFSDPGLIPDYLKIPPEIDDNGQKVEPYLEVRYKNVVHF